MARQASIPITDHVTSPQTTCTQYYITRYRVVGAPAYTTLVPNAFDTPIVIPNLLDNTQYDYEITRVCCDGLESMAATGVFDTTP
jgi:hypothetical protein